MPLTGNIIEIMSHHLLCYLCGFCSAPPPLEIGSQLHTSLHFTQETLVVPPPRPLVSRGAIIFYVRCEGRMYYNVLVCFLMFSFYFAGPMF